MKWNGERYSAVVADNAMNMQLNDMINFLISLIS